MSNIIEFPRPVPPAAPETTRALEDLARSLVADFAASSAAALQTSLDDLAKAIDKVAILVAAMPEGEARSQAEANLVTLRSQLLAACSLNDRGKKRD